MEQRGRKRVKVSGEDTIGDLFAKGVPVLSKGNESMQSSSHVYDTGHEHAVIDVQEIPFSAEDDSMFMPEDAEKDKSLLLQLLYGQRADGFTYQNETKVQNLVTLCLQDALRSQDLFRHFGVENEFSVFAYRPDIVVVSHDTKGIILVIEVKKPGVEVFTSPDVGGQVYDYLVGKLLTGVSRPFAVLTTYDEMCIAHLNDDGASREILERNANALNEDMSSEVLKAFGIGTSDDSEPSPSSPSQEPESQNVSSPQSKLNRVYDDRKPSASSNDDDSDLLETKTDEDGDDDDMQDNDDDDDSDEDWDREVVYTQSFGREDIMKALVLALRCGLEAVAKSEPRNVPFPGHTAIGSCARVNEKGLVWLNFPGTINFDYNQIPGSTTRSLYLWRDLGRGSSGRVFLACNSSGKACAVKFFLLDYDTYHRAKGSEEKRREWRETQMKFAKAEAEREAQYWMDMYGGVFKKEVRVVKLNDHWCLMMPYFDQISSDEREGLLPEVQQHLESFRSSDLQYNADDLRWRHVGVRSGSLYIFDLGSLEKCDKSKIDIPAQIDALRGKI